MLTGETCPQTVLSSALSFLRLFQSKILFNISPAIYPSAAPYRVLKYQTDFILQVPDRQPTYFQYKNPPAAPKTVKIIISLFLQIKSFMLSYKVKYYLVYG